MMINTKVFLLSLLSVVFVTSLFGIDRYQVGDSLFIIAKTGLNLRQDADMKSPVLTILPYGERVEVLAERHPNWHKDADSVQIIRPEEWYQSAEPTPAYWLTGRWVPVKYGEQRGYVFDGYLSRHPPFVFDRFGLIEDLPAYVERNYRLRETKVHPFEIDLYYADTVKFFDRGCTLERGISEKSSWSTVYIYDFSIEELMLYTSYLYRSRGDDTRLYLIRADPGNATYYFYGEIGSIEINAVGAMLMVRYRSWC